MSEDIHVKPADSQWTDDQWNAIVSSGQEYISSCGGWLRKNMRF